MGTTTLVSTATSRAGRFPVYRRLYDFAGLKRNAARYEAHCRATLDRVGERYGIESGVLRRPARDRASAA